MNDVYELLITSMKMFNRIKIKMSWGKQILPSKATSTSSGVFQGKNDDAITAGCLSFGFVLTRIYE
jgi:hypothetical protein